VAQRVSRAAVRVDGEVVADMGPGLLALVGVAPEDDAGDAAQLADKLVHLRVFPDERGRMDRSLLESGGTLGVVSQFTLLADTRRGRRPSYAGAARPEEAEPLVEAVIDAAREAGAPVVSGRFGAMMELDLVNTGPVTILLDTRPPP
jgi:D-tyrosyl-tRNA(Tyr) deacylase